jgi:hypothetical protein
VRPAERYGVRPHGAARRRRAVAVLAVLLALLGVAYAVWVGLAARGQAAFQTVGYEQLDDTHLLVTFTVTRPPGTTAVCEVEALSSGSAQVGLTSVEVPPSSEPTTTVRAEVRTQERPVTGQPVSCELR